ncbi:MAG: hypothetical protein K0M49_07840 [Arenimonas sp.]|nr:hypothetical protein [Rhizobium sp.]MBW8445527.1 hypothetical protein [Arenimonas sp.]
MAVMKQTRMMRDERGGKPLGVKATAEMVVDILDDTQLPWTKIRLATGDKTEGWVSDDAIDKTADKLGSLDKDRVAQHLVEQAAMFGANAFYLMAVAQLRSNVRETPPAGVSGHGPFAFTAKEWALQGADPGFGIHYGAEDISDWRAQCTLFAIMAAEAQEMLATTLGRPVSMVQLLLSQILGREAAVLAIETPATRREDLLAQATSTADQDRRDKETLSGRDAKLLTGETGQQILDLVAGALQGAFEESRPFIASAVETYVAGLLQSSGGAPVSPGAINYGSPRIKPARRKHAELIAMTFAAHGYGTLQQIAAIANAIAESGLDPDASNLKGERSFGLFQLNQTGGVGAGFPDHVLKDPQRNVEIMLAEIAKPYQKTNREAFATTSSLHEAVRIFVHHFERPAEKDKQTEARYKIAQGLVA